MSVRPSFEIQAFGRVGHVRISGVIDETFVSPAMGQLAPQIVIDVGGVQNISSFGVRRWIELFRALPRGAEGVSIVHAPPVVVDQLGMIADFTGVASVLSVLAPYECPTCGPDRLALIDLTSPATRSAIEARKAPARDCPVCQRPLRFSENPGEYFGFFRSIGRPSPPPVVEQFLRLLKMPDGLDSSMPFKLIQERVTYYQLRGKLMPNLNVRRMTGGLEGCVTFDFARVSSIEPGAKEQLSALLEKAAAFAEVMVSRVPAAVLNVLSSAAPVKLLSLMLPGQCRVCGEVRPHCLPAQEHVAACKRGAPPDRPCPVCGNPSLITPGEASEFLDRHPGAPMPRGLKALEAKALAHMLNDAAAASPVQPVDTGPEAPPQPTGAVARLDVSDLAAADSLLGRVVGNYRLTKLLGEGASACVYLGEHVIIESRVAVKILHQSLSKEPAAVERFIKEARITSTIVHDNVVQVLDINTVDQNLNCIVMEHLDGETMGRAFTNQVVTYAEAAPLLLQICGALAAAHGRGIVHRDLKPENIHLLQRGGRTQVKIVDFGIARRETLSDGEGRTQVGTILGTPQYMSPEQALGLTADSRADIYSLGVIMFELATGRPPFVSESVRALLTAHGVEAPPRPRSINPLIEADYEEVILRTLAKDPKDRFQTMGDLGRAIATIHEQSRLVGSLVTPPMGTTAPRPAVLTGPAMRRHPRLLLEVPVDVELSSVEDSTTRVRERMTMLDISLSGAFVRSLKSIPELFTRVVLHPMILGAHPLVGEVTRTKREEDPETLAVMRGFGVNFIQGEDSAEQEGTIQAILALTGEGAAKLPSLEAETEQFLARLESPAEDDHYALLGLPLHASFPSVRNACAQLGRVLASPQVQALDPTDLARAQRARDRISVAEAVLVDPIRRAAYDASRENFLGVANCLASGLEISALTRLREQFLATNPQLPERMRPLKAAIEDSQATGTLRTRLEGLTVALRVDPLDLDLHAQYWEVRRKLKAELAVSATAS